MTEDSFGCSVKYMSSLSAAKLSAAPSHARCWSNGNDFAGVGGAPNAERTNKRKGRADARKLSDSGVMRSSKYAAHVQIPNLFETVVARAGRRLKLTTTLPIPNKQE